MKHDLNGVREDLEAACWGQGFEMEGDVLRMDLSGMRSIWVYPNGDIDLSGARGVSTTSTLYRAIEKAIKENLG